MIARAEKYLTPSPARTLISDWESVARQKFDAVLATLVFQHLTLTELRRVVRQLANISSRLVVESAGELELSPGRRVLAEVLAVWYRVDYWPGDRDHWAGTFSAARTSARS